MEFYEIQAHESFCGRIQDPDRKEQLATEGSSSNALYLFLSYCNDDITKGPVINIPLLPDTSLKTILDILSLLSVHS